MLGILLRPFSLGHNLLLHRFNSPFVTGGKVGTDDLAASVFICAQTWADNLATLRDGRVERRLGPLTWREHKDRFMSRWQRKAGHFDFRTKVKAFQKYLNDGGLGPRYSFNASEMRSIDCPEVQLVYLALKERLHFSEAEICDRPWGWCRHDFVALKAIDGHVRLEGDLDEAQAAADEFEKRYAAN